MTRRQREGIFFALLAVVGYSFVPVFTKHILATDFSPLSIAFWRFLFAVPFIWAIVLSRSATFAEQSDRPLPRYRMMGIGMFMTAAALCAFFGLQRIPASTYIVLFYTYPAMVAVVSLFLGERLPMQGWLALALTLIGIALTAPDFSAGFSSGDVVGFLLAILNAIVVTIYFILNARLLRGHKAMTRASAWTMTGALIPLLIIIPFTGLDIPPNTDIWQNLIGLTIISTVLPIFSLTMGLNRLSASRVAITSTVEPLLTILLAVWLLNERVEAVQLIGGILIILSVLLLNTRIPMTKFPRRWVKSQTI